jgi:hypothetical protein
MTKCRRLGVLISSAVATAHVVVKLNARNGPHD